MRFKYKGVAYRTETLTTQELLLMSDSIKAEAIKQKKRDSIIEIPVIEKPIKKKGKSK